MDGMPKFLVIIPLLALLAASVWFALYAWTAIEGPPMPVEGHVAMWLGIVFSLVIGCGLMALVFLRCTSWMLQMFLSANR
jgi:hypothetical protein